MERPTPLRIALLWHDTVLSERRVTRGPVTVGEALDNTLTLPPSALGDRHHLLEAVDGAWRLHDGGTAGRLQVAGRERAWTGAAEGSGPQPTLCDGDWAQLDLGDFALLVQVGGEAVVTPPGARAARIETPLLATFAGALALHLAVLIGAFLLYEEQPHLATLDTPDRIARAWNQSAPQEEKPPPPIAEETMAEDPGKRADGKAGVLGEPDRTEPTRRQKSEGEFVNKIKEAGVHRALGSSLLGRGPLKSVFGDREGFANKLGAAVAGGDDALVLGHGSQGMGLRGTERGGGGEGFGRLAAMGTLDGGGGGRTTRTRLKTRTVAPLGDGGDKQPKVVGQFCKEADVQRVVASRRAGVQFCYESALRSKPDLQGKLTMTWRIGLDGSVATAYVDSNQLGDAEVASCVLRQIKRWKFTPPEGGQCQIRYPFVFSAGE